MWETEPLVVDVARDGVYGALVIRAVLDTNVIVAALKSSKGASHEILRLVDTGAFLPAVSVPVVTEYEDVLHRETLGLSLTPAEIDAVLDRICKCGINQKIHFLWRPFLPDPKDDMVFELALASRAPFIVTFNLKDFRPVEQFGIEAVEPKDFLLKL